MNETKIIMSLVFEKKSISSNSKLALDNEINSNISEMMDE